MKREACIAAALLFLFSGFAFADGGHMPPIAPTGTPPYVVYEPLQQAVVAWNDGNEVLILATTVRGNMATRALRVIPFPSEPSVEKGDWATFEYLQKFRPTPTPREESFDKGIIAHSSGGVQVVFHKRVGTHTLTAVRADNAGDLLGFAQGYEASSGMRYDFDSLMPVMENYIERGVKYFVFDLVEVAEQPMDTNPVIYSFESQYVFYPLEISSKTPDYGEVVVYAITPKNAWKITDYSDLMLPSRIGLTLKSESDLAAYDLMKVSKNVSALFNGAQAKLSVYDYNGKMSGLTQDFVLKLETDSYKNGGRVTESEATKSDAEQKLWLAVGVLLVVVAAVFFFIGRKTKSGKSQSG